MFYYAGNNNCSKFAKKPNQTHQKWKSSKKEHPHIICSSFIKRTSLQWYTIFCSVKFKIHNCYAKFNQIKERNRKLENNIFSIHDYQTKSKRKRKWAEEEEVGNEPPNLFKNNQLVIYGKICCWKQNLAITKSLVTFLFLVSVFRNRNIW